MCYKCYTRYEHRTSPPVYFVQGFVRVMRIMYVIRVMRLGPLSLYSRCSECFEAYACYARYPRYEPQPFSPKNYVSQIYVSRIMRTNPFPSIIVLNVKRDICIMDVMHILIQ